MSEETVVADPQEEVVAPESASKEAPPEAKAPEESQSPANDKVDVVKPEPQVPAAPRARPSDFYGFRKDIKSLKETISKRDQVIEEMAAYLKSQKSPETAPTKFDKDKFFTDPEAELARREKAFQDKVATLEAEIKSMKEGSSVNEHQKKEQGALEKLFPNQDGQNLSLEERMEAQTERMDKLNKLLKSMPVLDKAFALDPEGSADLILEKLNAEPAKNPTVLPKKLMGGAKGGSGAASNLSPKEQKMAELRRLSKEASENEELRFDEKHVARRTQLLEEIAKPDK